MQACPRVTSFGEMTPREIVDDMLRRFSGHMARRDVEAVVALFHDDGVLFGSEAREWAVGSTALRQLLTSLFARPPAYSWADWEPLIAGSAGDVVWFVSPATLLERVDGVETGFPYRLSGVLQSVDDRHWLFRQLNGSEPADGP